MRAPTTVTSTFRLGVIGTSAGGLNALTELLSELRPDLALGLVVVQHMSASSGDFLIRHLDRHCPLPVSEALDKECIRPGHVYVSPPNYHLLIEKEGTLALSLEDRVNFARPSIDVLFESAARAYGCSLIGVVLTGANADGSRGLAYIQKAGGLVVVQDPKSAEAAAMPEAALAVVRPDFVLTLKEIASLLNRLGSAVAGLRR